MTNKNKNKNQTKGICQMGMTLADRGIGNPDALALILRQTTLIMQDRRQPRGGSRNRQREYMDMISD